MDDVTGTFFLCLSNMARAFEMHPRLFRNKQVKDLKRWGSCASYLFVWFCFYHFLTLSYGNMESICRTLSKEKAPCKQGLILSKR